MLKKWIDVDFTELLELNTVMTVDELSDLTDILHKEIWYRVLNEELKKKLTKSQFDTLVIEAKEVIELDGLINYVLKRHPSLEIKKTVIDVSTEVKKEFVEDYLSQLIGDYKAQDTFDTERKNYELEIIKNFLYVLSQIKKDEFDFDKVKNKIKFVNRYIDLLNK